MTLILLLAQLGCVPSATFSVDGDVATMRGTINGRTPAAVSALLDAHPGLTTIEMLDVPGSMDDESNLEASRLIRGAGLHTHVPSDGQIASGGVDFFIAGASRSVDDGAQLGVHSWAAGSKEGHAFPEDAPEHDLYLDYYDEMGIDASFYWFTLDAADAAGIHWMTSEEIDQYGLTTEE